MLGENVDYDSTGDTLKHSQRVGELLVQITKEILDRATCHDRSKTEDPELAVFNEYTPKLRDSTYGSDEYKSYLAAMGEGLAHHYANNRHHPEHFPNGVDDMTLVDVIEMLADWRAATERHADGDILRSIGIQRHRFGLSDQLARILWNTVYALGWASGQVCGHPGRLPDGTVATCNVEPFRHVGSHSDGHYDGGIHEWKD